MYIVIVHLETDLSLGEMKFLYNVSLYQICTKFRCHCIGETVSLVTAR